jgi:DNA-binding CsgD family transcriptional regulator
MLQNITPGKPRLDQAISCSSMLQPLIAAAEAGEPLEPAMVSIIHGFGFESCGFAITTDPQPNQDSRSYVWTTTPREWIAEYDKNAYVEIDPRMALSFGRTTPVIWDAATIGGDARARKFLARAAAYGIRSGVAVSFTDARRHRIGASFNSSLSPVSASRHREIVDRLGDLMVLTAGIHDLFLSQVVMRGLPPAQRGAPLSRRERQCLQMAAHGMTSGDIGIKLGITERTANFHFSNILSKLDALNRHEAIAKAIRIGAIGMDL